jgi:glycosyltransferase involved in cell wall biosynthesis
MNINMIGSASFTGYGQVCRNLILELTKLGHKVSFFPKGKSQFNNQLEETVVNEAIQNSWFYDYNAPTVSVWHQHSLGERIGKGKLYAMPYFELDTFSEREFHHLSGADVVVATSNWAAEVLSDQLNKPIETFPVVQAGVNTDIFYPADTNSWNNTYEFINIGKWEKRKGHDAIIQAFNLAFSPTDDVELVMVTHNGFLNAQELNKWHKMYLSDNLMKNKVRLLSPAETQKDLANIIRAADCGVFMSRAEGWNLDLMEVMACGKPVISTYNTGMFDFLNSYQFLIETPEKEKAMDNKWFFGQGNWHVVGEKEIQKCADYMRHCFDNKITHDNASEQTAKKFTWENSANQLLKVLEN